MSSYTTFVFEGFEPVEDLHCTHVYFGEASDEKLRDIIKVLEKDFGRNPLTPFDALFYKPDLFGPEGDIPVLRSKLLAGLRPMLWRTLHEGYGERTFPTFKPHVSTTRPGPLLLRVVNYVLIKDTEIVWSAV